MSVVLVEERGRVLHITLNRPEKRNTLTAETDRLLRESFERFASDPELWVAVLSGNGPDFCAGVDLTRPDSSSTAKTWPGGITREFECWKPIVAALQGNVLGGGLELALCADFRIGDETTRIGAPEVRWGLMQGAGATQRLPRIVSFAVALEMLLTGDPVDADRAERIGLLNHVVAPGQALDRAFELAERLCSRAPLGVRRAKEAAYRGWDQTLPDGLRTEMLLSRLLAGTADLAEGQRAFLERRDPEWRAR
ncbi:MAG: enoyl-CoA hydratase/isomerase family protein [Actinomycetota bacterium]|nr:enoyl-CoA hydratase/isomerase family protein [Actinomycetota bacterium]